MSRTKRQSVHVSLHVSCQNFFSTDDFGVHVFHLSFDYFLFDELQNKSH